MNFRSRWSISINSSWNFDRDYVEFINHLGDYGHHNNIKSPNYEYGMSFYNSFLFYCQIIFHYLDIAHFVYSFSHLGCFHVLAVMNSIVRNVYILFLHSYMFLFLLGIYLG